VLVIGPKLNEKGLSSVEASVDAANRGAPAVAVGAKLKLKPVDAAGAAALLKSKVRPPDAAGAAYAAAGLESELKSKLKAEPDPAVAAPAVDGRATSEPMAREDIPALSPGDDVGVFFGTIGDAGGVPFGIVAGSTVPLKAIVRGRLAAFSLDRTSSYESTDTASPLMVSRCRPLM